MAVGGSHDGDNGWISDESDFYGGEAMQSELRARVGRVHALPIFGVKSELPTSSEQTSPATTDCGVTSSFDAVHFLKTRPQIDRARSKDSAATRAAKNSKGKSQAKDDLDDKPFEGRESALQHGESVTDFLRRAPITKASTAALGPWLWVGSRKINPRWRNRDSPRGIDRFTEQGSQMLHDFTARREKMEKENPGATPATITRKMGSFRDQLQDDLLKLAVQNNVTSGKWMLFPSDEDYPRWWRVVVEATSEGNLGPTSKASTHNEADPYNLIYIYTYDFKDRDDVQRVLEVLVSLGLCPQGKVLYYKCDAYTHLDIMSTNPYRLRASLYSSKEIFSHEANAKQDGTVDRVKKDNRAMGTFFSS